MRPTLILIRSASNGHGLFRHRYLGLSGYGLWGCVVNTNSVGPISPAPCGEKTGVKQCNESTALPAHVTKASAVAVSPAISHAAANGREQPKTETNASKSCNESGSQPKTLKPNCYKCKHRRPLAWSAHSECAHPGIQPAERILQPFLIPNGIRRGAAVRLGITWHQHGADSGWFMWPMDFDPVWLQTCSGFTPEENEGGVL